MKKSVIVAIGILFAIVAYFGVRTLLRGDTRDAVAVSGSQSVLETEAARQPERLQVVTRELISEPHEIFLTLKGRTAPNRTVTVRSATTGVVGVAPDLEGKSVARGDLLCRLDVEARSARVAEAEALLEAQRVDYEAAATLSEKGWTSPNRTNAAKASLDAAEATLNAARVELRRTELRAPFDGVFETRLAETGDFLAPGGACGVVTDLDPIRVEAEVTEDFASALQVDAPITVSVLNMPPREGKISYVARTANDGTRTFRVEASLDNADGYISAGLTTDLKISLGEALATPISAALLTLDDAGRVGVRHVDPQDKIVFSEVTVVDDGDDGIWVTGLPQRTVALAVGQEYIGEGALVTPVPETGPAR